MPLYLLSLPHLLRLWLVLLQYRHALYPPAMSCRLTALPVSRHMDINTPSKCDNNRKRTKNYTIPSLAPGDYFYTVTNAGRMYLLTLRYCYNNVTTFSSLCSGSRNDYSTHLCFSYRQCAFKRFAVRYMDSDIEPRWKNSKRKRNNSNHLSNFTRDLHFYGCGSKWLPVRTKLLCCDKPTACNSAPPGIGSITQPTCALATGSVTLNSLPSSGSWVVTRSRKCNNIGKRNINNYFRS